MYRWCGKFHAYFFMVYVCESNIYDNFSMKKFYFFFLLTCVVQMHISAQEIEPTMYTCGEFHSDIDAIQNRGNNPEDNFVDRFGNTHFKEINTNLSGEQRAIPLAPDYVSPEGLFAIYLTDQIADNSITDFNNDANYRNVIAQIFADLEQLIIENPATGVLEPVKIELQSVYSSSSSALASASSYYNYNGVAPGTIVDGEVWKAINTGANDSNFWDGFIKVNFFHSWYTDFSNPTAISGTNSFDMYAVLLHEIMHALGFASGIDDNGNPRNGNAFLTYDTLLHTDTGDDLIVPSGSSWLFNGALSTNVLTNGCPSTSEVRLGDDDLFVHTPQTYSSGSSLSHIDLDNDCVYPVTDYIMAYAVSVETPRRPITQEFDILCSLNYNLATQYGNNNVVDFGNPAVVTAQNNHTSNIVTYASCNPEVFGLDDFVDVATQPTIDNCQGSVLSILEQDLLNNDVSNLGLTLEVSNLSLNGSLITTFTGIAPNRTFLVSPNTVGNLQLTYKPMDTNGNLGNDTFANIVVTICTSLNCINTSSCNLICNPEFMDPTLGNIGSYNPFDMAYHMNTSGNGPSELDGWFAFNGSVSYYDFSLPQWIGTTEVPVNYFNLPGSSGEGAIALYGCSSNQINNGEALLTNVTIYNNVNYLLSINRNRWVANRACSYQVYLSDNNAISSWSSSTDCGGTTNILDGLPVQKIAFEDNITSNLWEQSLFCFTADDNYQSLILNAYSASTSGSHVLIDNVELIEDKFITNTANIQTTYDLICGQDANLGQALCLVSNLEYQYWDVTDVSNTFQLTNALVTPNYYVSDLNSSEVILNDIAATVNIELRRVFVNTNGVPININTCNTVLPITINVTPEKPQDGSFTNTEDSIDCLLHTFQASETYANHEWDFNNDGIIDISGPGSNVANTNPSYTFTTQGTYTVTHTVSNQCGSLTYQESINVLCGCPTSTTWNGTAWSNGVPDINTGVIINGNYNTIPNGSFSACQLTVNAGFKLTIQDATYVEVQTTTTVSGELFVETHGAFVQNMDLVNAFTLNPGGNALVNKYTSLVSNWYDYTYWSSPIVDETIGDALDIAPANRRFWYNAQNYLDQYLDSSGNTVLGSDDIDDDANDWQVATAGSIMTPGVGYAATVSPVGFMLVSYQATFEGAFNNGIIETPISVNSFPTDNDWNLIGNPYPSAIDFDDLYALNSGVIGGAAYLWSHASPPDSNNAGNDVLNFNANDYAIITVGSGNIAGSGTLTDNNIPNIENTIPSGQGFFVIGQSNGTLTFNNSMRRADLVSNLQFFRNANSTTDANKLWLNLTSEAGIFNQILIAYVDGATNGYDGFSYEATRSLFGGNASVIYTEIENDPRRFAIQGKDPNALNIDEIIPFGFYSGIEETTNYTISIPQLEGDFLNNNTCYLKDNLLDVIHDLNASNYSFTSGSGEFNNRFEILFNPEILTISENEIQEIHVYPNPTSGVINIKAATKIQSLKLYNNLGQLILENKEVNDLDVSKISEGIYFLKIKDVEGRINTTRIIKK